MEKELLVDHSYLIKPNFLKTLQEVKVLKVSKTAYKLQYDGAASATWTDKTLFWDQYSVQEDLGHGLDIALATAMGSKTY
jgi:hypothetical protein